LAVPVATPWTQVGGDETIIGGFGDDLLKGGNGADVFVFGNNDAADIIKDFVPAEDTILLQGASSSDDIKVATIGGNTIISYGDTQITLQSVEMNRDQVWTHVQKG